MAISLVASPAISVDGRVTPESVIFNFGTLLLDLLNEKHIPPSHMDQNLLYAIIRATTATVAVTFSLLQEYVDYIDREPSVNWDFERRDLLDRLYGQKEIDCYNQLRMGKAAFARLCKIIHETGRIHDTMRCTVEEQVARFLHILAHNVRNRTMGFHFSRFGETVSCHFNNVLNALLSLEDRYLIQPSGTETPPEIRNQHDF